VLQDRVLRRLLGQDREGTIGGWWNLHNENFHNFCFSPNIIRVIKFRIVRSAEHIAYVEMMEICKSQNPEGRRPL
jgi:hypothetical protein